MGYIKGTTVYIDSSITTLNNYGEPTNSPSYTTQVDNVLIGNPTSEQIINTLDLYGKRATVMLGIPKGDSHEWRNKKIKASLNGIDVYFETFGEYIEGHDYLVPLDWNRTIYAERIE